MKDWKVMNVEVMTILAFFEIQVSCSFEYLHIALACLYCTLSQNTPFETPHKHRAHISDGVDLTVHVMHTKNRHLLFTPVSASTRKCSVYCRKSC